ncbi:FliI/YscN family ATPase [Brucella anthropi]|uniref:FliI/YscN family ATPase n=1 Tax=Brucella anthropi TaxID=529 RepID=UPI00384D695A
MSEMPSIIDGMCSSEKFNFFQRKGRVLKVIGSVVKAAGSFRIGEICLISRIDQSPILAEVIGFEGEIALFSPFGRTTGISHNSTVQTFSSGMRINVGSGLAGRVVDGLGQLIDGRERSMTNNQCDVSISAQNPLTRPPIDKPFHVGLRVIDGILTCGEGQRVGIFAAAGGGKSTLITSLIRHANYDHCVVGLIGERGREVRELLDHRSSLKHEYRDTFVVATSDRPAIEQVKAAFTATTIAEYHRDRGKRVLLIIDSLTRFARAQRQIGLSAGEPPTRRGYTTSVFELLPQLVERAGPSELGSITAFYTVLVEGGDMDEPLADEVRSLLDGHIVLTRKLAEANHFPAVDVLGSSSRLFNSIVSEPHRKAAEKLKSLLSKYSEVELLLRLGEYVEGNNALADEAVQRKSSIDAFLRQNTNEPQEFQLTVDQLMKVVQLDGD